MDASTLALASDSNNAHSSVTQQTLPRPQQTLGDRVTCSGIGLHSGATVQVTLRPAPASTGRQFIRTDVPQAAPIPASVAFVQSTQLSTELGNEQTAVRTVEHLLAALVSADIDNVYIEIDGPELPLMDGSAQPWSAAIAAVGINPQSVPATGLVVQHPIWLYHGDAFVAALPAAATRLTYGIDFPVPAIGNQWHSWTPAAETFEEAIAPARTFTLAHHIEALQQQGLIKGGSLDNALVCDTHKGWLNPPLRFSNEPVRHKLLDLVGDLSLLGNVPQAHILAYKASHALHTQFARKLVEAYDNIQ